MELNEQPVPPAALLDSDSMEMLRVWIAQKGLHCSLRVGYYEGRKVREERAWGIMLADVSLHIARAIAQSLGRDERTALAEVIKNMHDELDRPTSAVTGEVSKKA